MPLGPGSPWINEFHYDNAGADAGEFIEIAGAAGADLTGYSLVLYNGNGGVLYDTVPLSGIIPNQQNGFGTLAFPRAGIQNGSPDGLALVAPGNAVVQFLSYEGTFTAVGGPADGLTSTDIGVSEPGTTPAGQSLQLTGTGTQYSDFTWHAEQAETSGAVNTGQSFGAAPPTVSTADASIAEGNSGTTLLTFTVTRSDANTDFTVDYTTADGTATSPSDYVAASNTLHFTFGGALTQQISITINGDTTQEPNETFTVNLSNLQNTVGNTAIADGSAVGTIINDDVIVTPIYTIQGSGHTSPLAGATVTTQGVVTAIDTTSSGEGSRGFYIQDPNGDGDAATSDGIFVFLPSGTLPTVGDLVQVSGTVQEFTPSGAAAGSFSSTEISSVTSIVDLDVGPEITPVQIGGAGGLLPPTSDLVAGGLFYESLEDMLVTVKAPTAVGPTNSFGEIFTVVDNDNDPSNGIGGATGLTAHGNLLISGGTPAFGDNDTVGGDYNPERIQIDADTGIRTATSDFSGFTKPAVDVGAKLSDVTGLITYAFANYQVLATQPYSVTQSSTLIKETGTLSGNSNHLVIASYNAENLDPKMEDQNLVQNHSASNVDDDVGSGKFDTIANQIFNTLHAPDIVAMQEVQDEDGAEITGDTSAAGTLQLLVDKINALSAAAGSTAHYSYIDNPFINNNANGTANGGQPGGNIRTAYIYRDDRVSLVANSLKTLAADGTPITTPEGNADQAENPDNPFYQSRPPLIATFNFNGQDITVIDNHFTSKGGSAPLLGSDQSPFDAGEVSRAAQAQAVNNFVDSVLSANPNAKIVVAGDLNEFQFEEPLNVLKGTASISGYDVPGSDPIAATATYTPGGAVVLTDLQDQLPVDQRYDYVFEGNSETLDHMLVSNNLSGAAQFDIVHLNAEFADQTSDHEPLVAGLYVAPVVSGQYSYTLAAGGTLTTSSGPAIIWDLIPPTTGTNATVDNAGAVNATSGRGIDTTGSSNGNNHFTLINHEGASITAADDAIRINANIPGGVVLIDNAGMISSATGQALDFNKITAANVSTTIINEASGHIVAADADAIRPGTHATIDNYGTIEGQSSAGDSGNDGIDFQDVGYGSVHNFTGGSIVGARHGITAKLPITIDNDSGASITGQLGSGINLDTASNTATTINNSGIIIGHAGGDSDGDGIDVDGLITLNNHGLVEGLGTWSGGLSEAVTVGGGTINNYADGTIHSVQRGITVDNSDLGNAFAPTTIYNEGTIQGDNGEAISITDTFADTLTNKGSIVGSVALGGGDDIFNAYIGSSTSGIVDGGDGNDTLNLFGTGTGTIGNLTHIENVDLFGGDWLLGSEGFASVNLEFGAQTLRLTAGTLADGHFDGTITGFGSDDLIDLSGIGSASMVSLGAGNVLTIADGSAGPVTLHLDPGQSFAGFVFEVESDGAGGTDLSLAKVTSGGNGNDTLTGTDGDDVISGGNGNDTINSGNGNDIVSGDNGNDVLAAGNGNNSLDGGKGNDVLTAGDGNNSLDGGNGNDVLTAGDGNNSLDGGNGNDVLTAGNGNNTFKVGNGNDTMLAGNGNNTFFGGNGNDIISAGNGNNSVTGGNGNETITLGNGSNSVFGGNGNDRVTVGDGNNNLNGGNGNDIFHVGSGNNVLTGGNGNDTFVFGSGFGKDVITDFGHGDHIEFDDVFQNFQAVQAVTHQDGANTVIDLDIDHSVTLLGVVASSLHSSDFILH